MTSSPLENLDNYFVIIGVVNFVLRAQIEADDIDLVAVEIIVPVAAAEQSYVAMVIFAMCQNACHLVLVYLL